MFNIFKRSAANAAKPAVKPASRKSTPAATAAPVLAEPVPVPEVVEGNDHSDWALWEDSMTILDSQIQSLTPSARIYEKEKQTPSELQDIDAFSNVGKNRDH
jgi:hypothetical protein